MAELLAKNLINPKSLMERAGYSPWKSPTSWIGYSALDCSWQPFLFKKPHRILDLIGYQNLIM